MDVIGHSTAKESSVQQLHCGAQDKLVWRGADLHCMHLMPIGSDPICVIVVVPVIVVVSIIIIILLFMQEIQAQQAQAMPRYQIPHSAH